MIRLLRFIASKSHPYVHSSAAPYHCKSRPDRHGQETEGGRGIAEVERSKHLAQREQSQVDEIGENDELWEQTTEGSDLSNKYQAAYAKCMKENQPE